MQYFTTLVSFLAMAGFASAAPTSDMAKREIGGLLICQGPDATGACHYGVYPLDTCNDLPDNLYNNASTFAPDGEGFSCSPRLDTCNSTCTSPEGCTMGAVYFSSSVKNDLGANQWQNLIGSFECHLNSTT